MEQNVDAKRAAAKEAVRFVEDGMVIGLGSGTTASLFIEALGHKKLRIQAVASSKASAELAKKHQIELIDINSAPHIHLTIDGADEIDHKKRMIKGGGGALLREKILASASDAMVVIVDHTKLVSSLGHVKLPVEVLFYGHPATRHHIEKLGYAGNWRFAADNTPYLTENGNLLFDIQFPSPPLSPESEHEKLLRIPGVLETGFFFHLAHRVIIGYADGHTEIQ